MKILSFNILSKSLAVSITKDNEVISRQQIDQESRHSELLIATIEDALKKALISYNDLDIIAAVTTPGSFTSTRIAYIVLNIMRISLPIPVIALDKPDIMAWKFFKKSNEELFVTFSCNMSEFYLTQYQPKEDYFFKCRDTRIVQIEELTDLIAKSNCKCLSSDKHKLINYNKKISQKIKDKFFDHSYDEVEVEDIGYFAHYLVSNNLVNNKKNLQYFRQPNIGKKSK